MEAVENCLKYVKDRPLQWNPAEYMKMFQKLETFLAYKKNTDDLDNIFFAQDVWTAPKNPMTT